jgi:hypothetical protein
MQVQNRHTPNIEKQMSRHFVFPHWIEGEPSAEFIANKIAKEQAQDARDEAFAAALANHLSNWEQTHPDIQLRFWMRTLLWIRPKKTWHCSGNQLSAFYQDAIQRITNEEFNQPHFFGVRGIPSKDRLHVYVLCKKEEFGLPHELQRLVASYLP